MAYGIFPLLGSLLNFRTCWHQGFKSIKSHYVTLIFSITSPGMRDIRAHRSGLSVSLELTSPSALSSMVWHTLQGETHSLVSPTLCLVSMVHLTPQRRATGYNQAFYNGLWCTCKNGLLSRLCLQQCSVCYSVIHQRLKFYQ